MAEQNSRTQGKPCCGSCRSKLCDYPWRKLFCRIPTGELMGRPIAWSKVSGLIIPSCGVMSRGQNEQSALQRLVGSISTRKKGSRNTGILQIGSRSTVARRERQIFSG